MTRSFRSFTAVDAGAVDTMSADARMRSQGAV